MKRIINVLWHTPPYEWHGENARPPISWDTANGKWVGIWGYHFPDQIGHEVLKITDDIHYEVWQPDTRADKVYKHTFDDGLVKVLFPAQVKRRFLGNRFIFHVVSKSLVEALAGEVSAHKAIIHLNNPAIAFNHLIIDRLPQAPIVMEFHGDIAFPIDQVLTPSLNVFGKFHQLRDHLALKRRLHSLAYVVYKTHRNLDRFSAIYRGPKMLIPIGTHYDFWLQQDKAEARTRLALPQDKYTLLWVGRLVSFKQFDRLVEVLTELSHDLDFVFVVVGKGSPQYEVYARQVAADLIVQNRIRFEGYVRGERLRDYYNACDLFVRAATDEGGPVASFEAMGCEVPIFTTDTGLAAEVLETEGAGVIVPRRDYAAWSVVLRQILTGKRRVRPLRRAVAVNNFDWPIVARKYLQAYKDVADGYDMN